MLATRYAPLLATMLRLGNEIVALKLIQLVLLATLVLYIQPCM